MPARKIWIVITLCIAFITVQTFGQKEHHEEEPPKNLKVLPQNISGEELHSLMRMYANSLGVRCGFCHAVQQGGGGKPKLDFASDEKEEKNLARGMIKMVDSINNMLDNMGNHNLEHITCVSCHHGTTKPIVSVDSLVKKDHQ